MKVIIVFLVILSFATLNVTSVNAIKDTDLSPFSVGVQIATCGDDVCNVNEDCLSCSEDCGVCVTGDGRGGGGSGGRNYIDAKFELDRDEIKVSLFQGEIKRQNFIVKNVDSKKLKFIVETSIISKT